MCDSSLIVTKSTKHFFGGSVLVGLFSLPCASSAAVLTHRPCASIPDKVVHSSRQVGHHHVLFACIWYCIRHSMAVRVAVWSRVHVR